VPDSQIALSAQQILTKAREIAGVDLVDDAIETALEKLLLSLNTETRLTADGALALEKRLLHKMANRLRMERDFQNHPDIGEQQVTRPLFITGMGRTGSTKLQRLLAASGDFLYIPCWQSHSPAVMFHDRTRDTTARIQIAEQEIRYFNSHAPGVETIHPFEPMLVDEESVALEHCLFAPWMAALAFVPGYAMWRIEQGFEQDFRYLKRMLQYLQWQFYQGDHRPWILKSPAYPGLEPLLKQVFPDASFVTTHRDPVAVVSSAASLLSSFHGAWSQYDPKNILGPLVLEQLAAGADNHIAGRKQYPGLDVLDVSYRVLTADALTIIERVYEHNLLKLTPGSVLNMQKWESEHKANKHGVHHYDLADYHLSEAMVKNRFRQYIRRFEHYL
jgi:Sulfotransferase family